MYRRRRPIDEGRFTHQIEEFPVGDVLVGMTILIDYKVWPGERSDAMYPGSPDEAEWDVKVIELDEYAADDGVTLEMAQAAWKEADASGDYSEMLQELIFDEACV
jgi:hypothetical protein